MVPLRGYGTQSKTSSVGRPWDWTEEQSELVFAISQEPPSHNFQSSSHLFLYDDHAAGVISRRDLPNFRKLEMRARQLTTP